jgi:hypothetical protein
VLLAEEIKEASPRMLVETEERFVAHTAPRDLHRIDVLGERLRLHRHRLPAPAVPLVSTGPVRVPRTPRILVNISC